ncbi:hypothetical protein BV25DRAFT_1012717 [Artomyces pyxidatus]|uniref:Uncharacterized protein n=1 Tax=Artomyces pyxidatus TaxID=48021 RepID=A0ACB8SV04_9AGAM|nr:hypothetical protein BV25DRAFT_1012717 [Artomyces pyxidatus]
MSHTVPLELVFKIFEHVYYLPEGSPDRKTLAACAIVCKAWTSEAQRLLFIHTKIGSKGCAVATQIQYIINKPALGTYIRSLQISVSPRRHPMYSRNYHISEAEFVTLVSQLSQLYQLTARFMMTSLDATTVDKLSQIPLRLQAVDMMSSPSTNSSVIYQLFEIWPSIQFLCVRMAIPDPPQDTPRPPFSLYELRMIYPMSRSALEWFIPPSQIDTAKPLQILDVGDMMTQDYSEDLVLAHAPRLRSLSIMNEPKSGFFDTFTCLEEFAMRCVPLSARTPPETVQHLGLYVKLGDLVKPLLFTIAMIRTLPRLRCVTVHGIMERHKECEDLRAACREKGVDLVITNNPTMFALPQQELVPVDTFPRVVRFTNLRKYNSPCS